MTEKTFWRTVRKNGTTGLIPADSRTAEVASEYRAGLLCGAIGGLLIAILICNALDRREIRRYERGEQ